MKIGSLVLLLACCRLLACGETRSETAAPTAPPSVAIVDSIHPVAEQIRRFKAQLRHTMPRAALASGASSRDELVQGFISALERQDTAVLRQLVIDPMEFIDLYYPASIYSRAPYQQNPALVWFFFQQNGEKGIARALQRFGGRPAGFRHYRCASEPVVEGENTLWQDCVISWQHRPTEIRLFGTIIERAGAYKFVSYANDQ